MSALSLHRLSSHDVEDLRGEIHPPADPFHLYHAYHALRWAEDDCGVSIVPMEPKEKLPEGLIAKAITGVDTDLYKTVVRVKGRPLSVVAKKFLQFYSDVRDSERMIKIKDL